MLRLLKYLKPYLLLILITIGLLFVQAMADLALPNYMSEIVNVGIQQGGIESSVPEAIRQSKMEHLTIFMTSEEKNSVLSDYTLVEPNSSLATQYVGKYPILKDEAIYVLNEISDEERTKISSTMGKTIMIVSTIEEAMIDPQKAAALAKLAGFDLSKLPAGMDIFSTLEKVPACPIDADDWLQSMKNFLEWART